MSKALAEMAVGFVRPAIDFLMSSGVLKRRAMHIVIVNPLYVPTNIEMDAWIESMILHEESIGSSDEMENFQTIARSKAFMSWRTQLPTHLIQTRAPFLVPKDQTTYYGSACSDGLVVACSGVQPHYDQMIAAWVLEAFRARAIETRGFVHEQHLDANGVIVRQP